MSDLKNNIADSLRELNNLHNRLPSGDEKNKVGEQILYLTNKNEKIRDKTLDEKKEEYVKATEALEKAIPAIKDALKDIKKVSEAIQKVADAISLLSTFLIGIGLAGK